RAPTPARPPAAKPYPDGYTSTITTDPTPHSEANHPSPASPTSVGRTASIGDVPRRSLLPHPARLARLLPGLVLFGVSVALMVRADLGLASWDVFHQGLAHRTGMPIGWAVIVVSVAVLLL